MKRALVTGAAGFIGTQLVKTLLSKDYDVSALIEKNDTKSENKLVSISDKINIIKELDSGKKYLPFDVVYHLATVGIRPGLIILT